MSSVAGRAVDDLEELYRAHATHLLRLGVVLTGNRHEAEELVQEAFVRYHRARSPQPGTELAYLRRTVINLSHGRLRRLAVARRRSRPGPPGDGSEVTVASSQHPPGDFDTFTESELIRFDTSGDVPREIERSGTIDGRALAVYVDGGRTRHDEIDPSGRLRDLAVDGPGRWILTVDGDGVLAGTDREAGETVTIPGRYLSADW